MKSFMSFLFTLCLSQVLFAQTLQPLNSLNELDITATAVQFKNVATGQYVVLKPAPQGGGSLEGSATPDGTPWYFYQAAGAGVGNVEIKRKPVDGFNWSNYDNVDDNKAAITWNHAKRIPDATNPSAPHAWTIEEVSAGVFKIKWNQNNEYLELMPNLKLDWLQGTGPKIITCAFVAGNKHQLWTIEVNSKVVSCVGKQFKVDAEKKIWEKRDGNWVHVGDRCNQLSCNRRRVFCVGIDGSVWRYNDQPHNWTPANTLLAGQFLNGGDGTMYEAMHLQSANGKHFFYMQENGDLGLWTHNPTPTITWNSKTFNKGANCTLHMQTDGNLVAYDKNNQPIWASETQEAWDVRYNDSKYKPVRAVLEDNGQLVLYSETGFRVWDTAKGKYPLN